MANYRTFPDFDLKTITKELFDATAHECAKVIAFDGTKNDGTPKESVNTATQLRRFYDEFEMWNERTIDEEAFKNNVPFIYMMKSKVAYALGRKNIDETYQKFFNKLVDKVDENNIQTLRNAKLFLEAFMGFYKQYRAK